MKLPIIKRLVDFVEERDPDFLLETIETLEDLTELSSLNDDELDLIGELLSNMYGALEVYRDVDAGSAKKEALRTFMGRVMGSIDR